MEFKSALVIACFCIISWRSILKGWSLTIVFGSAEKLSIWVLGGLLPFRWSILLLFYFFFIYYGIIQLFDLSIIQGYWVYRRLLSVLIFVILALISLKLLKVTDADGSSMGGMSSNC